MEAGWAEPRPQHPRVLGQASKCPQEGQGTSGGLAGEPVLVQICPGLSTFPAGFLRTGALMHSWGPRVCPSPEPSRVHIMAGPRVFPSLAATLTSNAGPKVASVALYQAVQVREPRYLQVGTNIVANVIHCPGNARSTPHRQGTRDRACPGKLGQEWTGRRPSGDTGSLGGAGPGTPSPLPPPPHPGPEGGCQVRQRPQPPSITRLHLHFWGSSKSWPWGIPRKAHGLSFSSKGQVSCRR